MSDYITGRHEWDDSSEVRQLPDSFCSFRGLRTVNEGTGAGARSAEDGVRFGSEGQERSGGEVRDGGFGGKGCSQSDRQEEGKEDGVAADDERSADGRAGDGGGVEATAVRRRPARYRHQTHAPPLPLSPSQSEHPSCDPLSPCHLTSPESDAPADPGILCRTVVTRGTEREEIEVRK